MRIILISTFISIIATSTCGSLFAQSGHPTATMKVRVVDENGLPVVGALAGVGFEMSKKSGIGTESVGERGLTDNRGEALFRGQTPSGYVSYGARAEGYYVTTNLKYQFEAREGPEWLPKDKEVDAVLKKIGSPVPMYVRRVSAEIPATTQIVGFDLMAGDWVAPHGKGLQGDLLCKVSRRFVNRRDYDVVLEIIFASHKDGVVPFVEKTPLDRGSELRMPRTAPEEGYQSTLQTAMRRRPSDVPIEDARPDMNYFFRVRTVLDESGRIKSALYGKVHGDIQIDPFNSKTCVIIFNSYLNPTPNDRNVEWDRSRNLAKGLTVDEELSAP